MRRGGQSQGGVYSKWHVCVCLCVCVCVRRVLSPVQLFDPMDCSPPGSSVHGISQATSLAAQILKSHQLKVAMLSSRGSSGPRDRTHVSGVSCIARHVLDH